MRGKNNRQRILDASIELFNRSGTVDITTNHIARHLNISPGNLYFHFSNKEEIVRELFAKLCADTYGAWDPGAALSPGDFLERSFNVFWEYRFFHREMYHLRRSDQLLNKAWKRHMARCYGLLNKNYHQWVEAGLMREVRERWERKALSESLMLSSSAFLGFFEGPDKPASRKSVRAGVEHVSRLLRPYLTM
jgi:AcrR family transcriptional regulator